MPDHTDTALTAVIKSLRDVVAPAVDTSDPMAQEQLALVLGTLQFLQLRLPYLAVRERVELSHSVALGRDIVLALGHHEAAALDVESSSAAVLLDSASPTTAQLHRATASINAAVRALLRSRLDSESLSIVEKITLEHADDRIDLERSWYAPMGFDPDTNSVEPLDKVLPR